MTGAPSVEGAVNFRDVGGLPAETGRTRAGVLFRSGNLAHVEPAGADALRALGIRRIIDLRSDDEVELAPSRVTGIEMVRVPLFLGSVASFFQNDVSLDEMYRELLLQSSSGIVRAVRGIAGRHPVLVHCTVGKDRTGVTVALALAAAGVDEDAIVADYALTESMLPEWRSKQIVARLKETHPEARHVVDLATRSPAPVMRGLLADVAEHHGSAAEYLRTNGVTKGELASLRDALIEPRR